MAVFTNNAISVTARDRAKQTKIWDHNGYKSQRTDIFKNSMVDLTKNAISLTVRDRATKNAISVTVWDRVKHTKISDKKG